MAKTNQPTLDLLRSFDRAEARMAWAARDEEAEKEFEDCNGEEEAELVSSGERWTISSLKVDALVIPCLLLYAIFLIF